MTEELPAGWALAPINSFTSTKSGNSKLIKGKLEKEPKPGLFPAFSASGQDVWVEHPEHEGDAIIISAVGARCGKTFRACGKWSAIANTHIVWPEKEAVSPDWLQFRLNDERFWERGGSAQPFVKVKATFEREIPLPPLAEQRRIVRKLDRLTAHSTTARTHLTALKTLVERYKAGVITLGISGALTADWRQGTRLPEPREAVLADHVTDVRYGSSAKSSKTGAVPVLRMGNIQNRQLDWGDLVYTSNAEEIEKYALEPGDILFNRTNSAELVGKTAIYRGEQTAIFAGYLIRVRCAETLDPEFLNLALNSSHGRQFCWRVKSDSVSQSNINAKKLKSFEFPLPHIKEQREIVRRIDAAFARIDLLAGEAERALKLLGHLDQRILERAFCGGLVSQNPDDEPAAALLARIKATRAATPAKKRRRRAKA